MSPRQKKPKTPPAITEGFPADETPTPTRILKMADMDLFGELKVRCHSCLAHSFIRREIFSRIPPASTVGKKTLLMLTSEKQRKQLNKAKTFKRTFKYFPVNFISCTPGADSISATVTAPLLDHGGEEESLNTPQIYCTEAPPLSLTQPTTTTASTPSTTSTSLPSPQPVILKVQRIFRYNVLCNAYPIRCSPAVSRHSNQLPPHP